MFEINDIFLIMIEEFSLFEIISKKFSVLLRERFSKNKFSKEELVLSLDGWISMKVFDKIKSIKYIFFKSIMKESRNMKILFVIIEGEFKLKAFYLYIEK